MTLPNTRNYHINSRIKKKEKKAGQVLLVLFSVGTLKRQEKNTSYFLIVFIAANFFSCISYDQEIIKIPGLCSCTYFLLHQLPNPSVDVIGSYKERCLKNQFLGGQGVRFARNPPISLPRGIGGFLLLVPPPFRYACKRVLPGLSYRQYMRNVRQVIHTCIMRL